ncbi:MAG: succinate dehydrogenase / fumarate reductase, iron-sulfur subunit [Acidobacteriota bacterium]|jgi:succinate dehydrogenase / fumarate reductase iron-sulfur subunit|nr:succinate dehydrogenase / fumarate reductase, iron-sulfur subunit [Acidobacteriota bacterium]
MDLTLHVWRQKARATEGGFVSYKATNISPDASFLEMLDVVNEGLIEKGEEPIHFEHDCREGICGSCGMMINGVAHGPMGGTATCQLHMRHFTDGDDVIVEPWRARAFPVIKDLIVDRSPLDKIVQAGGYISVNTGSAPEANSILIPKEVQELSMDAAECIQCGACVAQCPNGAANLFTAAKMAHLNLLPQGQPERYSRAVSMVETMESYFGSCTMFRECEAVCPKGISTDFIARMNRDFLMAKFKGKKAAAAAAE